MGDRAGWLIGKSRRSGGGGTVLPAAEKRTGNTFREDGGGHLPVILAREDAGHAGKSGLRPDL